MIAPKLRLLLNTKKDLQAILKVPNGVPFNQYVRYLAWVGEPIPKAHLFGDYVKGRFTAGGKAVLQDEVGEFTRLSKATNFVGGELVEYEVGEARIEAGKGLLVEPQRTNLIPYSASFTSGGWGWPTNDITLTAPNVVAPDGTISSTKIVVSEGEHTGWGLYHAVTGALVDQAYAFTVYLKKAEYRYARICMRGSGNYRRQFLVVDLETAEIVGERWPDLPILHRSVVSLANGWVRVTAVMSWSDASFTAASVTPASTPSLDFPFGTQLAHTYTGDGVSGIYIWGAQIEVGILPTSYIPTEGVAMTRSPDILNIPLLPTQTITGDWDAGVMYSLAGDITTFTGHGYIRNLGSMLNPLILFEDGEKGAWYDPSDLSTLFQDAAGTIPVTAAGEPVGLMLDKSGNGHHVTQTVSAARPTYHTDGTLHWLESDGVDDQLKSGKVFTVDAGFYAAAGFEVTALGGISSTVGVFGAHDNVYLNSLYIRGTNPGAQFQVGCATRIGGERFSIGNTYAFGLVESFVLSGWHESNVLYFSKNSGELSGNIAADVLGASRLNNELIIFQGPNSAPMRFYGGVWLDNSVDDNSKLVTEKYLAIKSGVTLL